MNGLRYFFRGGWEDYSFKIFSPLHFVLLAIGILGIVLIVKYQKALRGDPRRWLKKTLLTVLLLEVALLYGWYILAGAFTLGDGLPLYICRTAIIAIILGLTTKSPSIRSLAVYWGTLGGTLALLLPVLYPMHFPHITNFTYFVGHTIMIWSVTYIQAVEGFQLSGRGLLTSLAFTNIFNLGVFWLNPRINGNYSYFETAPVQQSFFETLSRPVYVLIVFLTYNLLIVLIHVLLTQIGPRLWGRIETDSTKEMDQK